MRKCVHGYGFCGECESHGTEKAMDGLTVLESEIDKLVTTMARMKMKLREQSVQIEMLQREVTRLQGENEDMKSRLQMGG